MPTDLQLANKHQYVTEHGRKPAPGVTTITSLIDKPALKWASSEVAAKTALDVLKRRAYDTVVYEHRQACMRNPRKRINNSEGVKIAPRYASDDEIFVDYCRGEFDRQWKAKADKGSRIHEHALAWSQGKDIEQLPDEAGYLDALEKWMIDFEPESIYDEIVVLHPNPAGDDSLEYGGRTDKVADIRKRGWTGINLIDFKTGREGYIEDKALQAAGYWGAKGIARYNPDGSLGTLDPMPKIKRAMTVYLREDGTYGVDDPLKHVSRSKTFAYFLHLRRAWNSHKKIEAIEKEMRGE